MAVLYQDHLTIYDKDLQEYAVLKDVSAAGTVLMRSDGSAVLTGAVGRPACICRKRPNRRKCV